MDENTKIKIEKTVKALARNNMQAFVAKDRAEAAEIARSLMKKGGSVTCGGSVTLKECGITDIMQNGDYDFIDRSKAQTDEERKAIYRRSFCADVYLTSANAITENGELYNVDGNSNRIAAIAYGPDRVIVVAGINKLVRDIDEAVKKMKTVTAPAVAKLRNAATACSVTGKCVCADEKYGLADGCAGARICCNYLISGYQRYPDRIKVIIVEEELGL